MTHPLVKAKGFLARLRYKMKEEKITLDSVEMTVEELQEKKNTLGADKRIVEVSEGVYETVTRLNG